MIGSPDRPSSTPTPSRDGTGASRDPEGQANDAAIDDSIDLGRLKSSMPAIATDIGMGILFFATARLFDLRTAAIVSASVGIALYPLQWLIRRVTGRDVNLLGGMALFGIAMLLLSAGFSWWVESDLAIQLKGTVIGGAVAVAYAVDAMFDGRWLGRRLTLYLAYNDIDERRLAIGMFGVGAALAGLNTAFALGTSREAWLMYTSWGDTIASMALAGIAVQRARRGARATVPVPA